MRHAPRWALNRKRAALLTCMFFEASIAPARTRHAPFPFCADARLFVFPDFDANWLHATHGFTRFHWAIAAGEGDVLAELLHEDNSPPPCHFDSDARKDIVTPGDSGNIFTLSVGGMSALALAKLSPKSRPTAFSYRHAKVGGLEPKQDEGARRKHTVVSDDMHEMMVLATGSWNPRAHKYFPPSFRNSVFFLLCIAERLCTLVTTDRCHASTKVGFALPRDAWFNIFSFFGRYEWQPVPTTCKCETCRK